MRHGRSVWTEEVSHRVCVSPDPSPAPRVERLVHVTLEAFYDVYNTLGHGFLEIVYARAMECELRRRRVPVAREVLIEARYKEVVVGHYRADLIVAGRLVVEIKATPVPRAADRAQLTNYLRAGALVDGLLLQFGEDPRFWRLRVAPER